jgi:hypothetical protein
MTPSRCVNRQEAITALVLGLLDSQQATELQEHLLICAECVALYEEMLQEEAFLQTATATMRVRAASSHLQAAHVPGNGFIAAISSKSLRSTLRMLRWKHLPTLAIAAILLLAATGLFSWLNLTNPSSGVAFGAVMQQIGGARTVTYTMTVQFEGRPPVVRQEMATDRGLFRSANSRGAVRVLDFANNREIYIDPTQKIAMLTHKPLRIRQDRTLISYLGWLDPVHESEGTWTGQADLDGTRTNVFSISRPFQQITIWTDMHTNLPVRVERVEMPCLDKDIRIPEIVLTLDEFRDPGDATEELAMGADAGREIQIALSAPGVCQEKKTTVLADFTWNEGVDESLLQVAAPAGYQVTEVDDGDPPHEEHALVAALRFWAESSEGSFPADINMLLDSKPLLILRFGSSAAPEQGYAEAVRMAHIVVTGSLFSQKLKTVDNWNYAGGDVKLGQADEPLCWWKGKDPAIYQVIYGDLSIRDVPATDMTMLDKP